jgi:hypothetical protein
MTNVLNGRPIAGRFVLIEAAGAARLIVPTPAREREAAVLYLIQPVASADANAGMPFLRASPAIALWS